MTSGVMIDSSDEKKNEQTNFTVSDDISEHFKSKCANSSEWKAYNPSELGVGNTYKLGISAVVPRPVAVITSLSSLSSADDALDTSILNCAPFSYTGLCSHDPPIVSHGICLSKGKKKDTLVNIEATGEWVFNVLTSDYLEEANQCAEDFPPDVNELEKSGLSTLPSHTIQTPRIKEAKVAMECKLDSTKEVFNDDGKHTTTIVFGRVIKFHVHQSVLSEEGGDPNKPTVDLDKLKACGRVGDVTYWPAGDGKKISMDRP